jgi:hypothetical protein
MYRAGRAVPVHRVRLAVLVRPEDPLGLAIPPPLGGPRDRVVPADQAALEHRWVLAHRQHLVALRVRLAHPVRAGLRNQLQTGEPSPAQIGAAADLWA